MTLRKLVAVAIAAALLLGMAPAGALAGDNTTNARGIRASIEKAVAKNVADHPSVLAERTSPRRAAAAQGGGGGGGKTMAVVAILSTIGGLAATYFVVKQMRKTTNAAGH